MSRPHHTDLFDHEFDDAADLTSEFWGDGGSWQPRRRTGSNTTGATRAIGGAETTGTMRAIRDGVAAFRPQRMELRDATGQVRRTRAHGRGLQPTSGDRDDIAARRADATIGELAAGRFDDPLGDPRPVTEPRFDPFADDAFADDPFADDPSSDAPRVRRGVDARHRPPSRRGDPRRGHGSMVPLAGSGRPGPGVDPLLVRLGALVLVGVLLVPVALSLRPSDPSSDTVQIEAPTGASETPAAPGAAPAADPNLADATAAEPQLASDGDAPAGRARPVQDVVAEPAPSASATSATGAGQPDDGSGALAETDSVAETTQDATSPVVTTAAGISEAATVDAEAERVVPACPQTYTAAPGDSWYRIADAAGVSPDALMTENRATIDTVILPGDEICLPAGATMPAPPTTTPATTTPATTTPATTSPATTQPPATTPPGSPGRDATVAEIKALIRSIFPESEWETAYTIADRESRFDPEAYNGWCCYGVFQIYWDVHRSWLDELGITSSDDLFDPLLNVQAAYAIWQRAGNSWRPWSTYDG